MRSLKLLAAAAVLVVAVAAPAAAHVAVESTDAAKGGEAATLGFRVPNEAADAATVKVEVQLPTDQTFEFVRVRALAGWTATVTDTTITWSGGRIAPGQFQEFDISVGPLPEVDELTFKAIQTYDNGDVVRWIEPTPADGTEPEHPAPVLHLTAATTATTVAVPADSDDGDGKVVGAYALAAVALALAATAFVQVRRKPGKG